MAFSLNRAQLIGNVTRPPEVRMAGAHKVASFSIATNRSWKDQSGQRKDKAEFHNIVAWSKLAEICELYLKKGTKVYIEGRMQTRDWEGEDGVKRYRTEIVAENLIMLGSKGEGSPAEATQSEESAPDFSSDRPQKSIKTTKKPAAVQQEEKEEEVSIDDLPF